MKILVDANVVEEETLNLFEKNSILNLVKRNKIAFYLSDILFGECIFPNLSDDTEKTKPLIEKFFQYADERIYAPICEIINKEIRKTKGKYWFLPLVESKNLKKNTFDKNTFDKISKYYYQLKSYEDRQYKLFQPFLDGNKKFISQASKYSKSYFEKILINTIKTLDLPPVLEHQIINDVTTQKTNKEKIKTLIRFINLYSIYKKEIGSKISQLPESFNTLDCQYLTNYISAIEYHLSYSFLEPKEKIDKYFRDDFYVCYMKDLDILLSKDSHYMKNCLNYVYNNKKLILSPVEFINYLKNNKIC